MIYLKKGIFLSFPNKVLGALEPHSMDSLGNQLQYHTEKSIPKITLNLKCQSKAMLQWHHAHIFWFEKKIFMYKIFPFFWASLLFLHQTQEVIFGKNSYYYCFWMPGYAIWLVVSFFMTLWKDIWFSWMDLDFSTVIGRASSGVGPEIDSAGHNPLVRTAFFPHFYYYYQQLLKCPMVNLVHFICQLRVIVHCVRFF